MSLTDWLSPKRRRRKKILAKPFPQEWLAIIEKNVPYYRHLDPDEQDELQRHVQIFVAERHFIGCGGLDINDEIRVTIAAQACVLLLHRDREYRSSLKTIFVYPHHYIARGLQQTGDGLFLEGPSIRLGESWHRGPVVLSWDDVLKNAADVHDGHNVVFHEFAHQLDDENGSADGAPPLPKRSMYLAWARVLGHDYEQLVENVKHHHKTFIDAYGATNPAEFFAVASETFFEKPIQLRHKNPDLYEQLKICYNQDPAGREMRHKNHHENNN
ncbi:MAG TPA: zinc-dependent peptidase [Phycisphaerae bacterium]|mgnify:CR=1 FL=1|nr:zinc-dependent peptidase [Phycisphaerae bacterium]HPS53562.1 zinc-dependent peptidase [Phycisphaerae bacterium]